MAWRRSTRFAATLAAMIVPLATAGCADDNVSLRIECSIVPTASGDVCTYDPAGDCLLDGVLNVKATDHYTAALRLTSGLSSRQSDNPVRAESNGIEVKSYEIEVQDPSGKRLSFTGLPNPFRTPSSGFIPPGESGVVPAQFLPPAYVKQIAASAAMLGQVVVSVVAHAKTQGGVDVETDQWQWPVRLIQIDPNNPKQCTPATDTICNFGQDIYAYTCTPTQSM